MSYAAKPWFSGSWPLNEAEKQQNASCKICHIYIEENCKDTLQEVTKILQAFFLLTNTMLIIKCHRLLSSNHILNVQNVDFICYRPPTNVNIS